MDGTEFMRRMHAGDVSIWGELKLLITGIALGACRDLGVFDDLKEDIVQDVLVRVFEKWQTYSGDSALSTWIYSIARNRCLDELRKRAVRGESRHSKPDSTDEDSDYSSHTEGSYDEKFDLMLCVQQMLSALAAQLPSRKNSRRNCDILEFWVEHDPTTEELAEFLGSTLKAAKQRKYEIRKHIEELCEHYCGNVDCSLQFGGSMA